MIFSRKTVFLTVTILIVAGGIAYLGIQAFKPMMIPIIQSGTRSKVPDTKNVKPSIQTTETTEQTNQSPTTTPVLTKEVFDAFHLRIISVHTDSEIGDYYPGLHDIQNASVMTPKGNVFLVDEFMITDRKALMAELGEPTVKIGDRNLYSHRSAGGMVNVMGLFFVSKQRALFVELGNEDWKPNADPETIDFLKNVQLP